MTALTVAAAAARYLATLSACFTDEAGRQLPAMRQPLDVAHHLHLLRADPVAARERLRP